MLENRANLNNLPVSQQIKLTRRSIFKKKVATTKTSLSGSIESPHSEASRILLDYTSSHLKKFATRGFLQVACKKGKASTSDIISWKDAPKSHEANAWREAIKVE